MSLYEKYLLPPLLDFACGMKAINRQRGKLVPRARGLVLEPGMGSGLNLCHYQPEQVEKIYGVDPAAAMNALAKQRIAAAGLDVECLQLSAERLPAEDDYFDTVVLTFTLCTIPDPVQALLEMRRVLKPGGTLLFCEHGLAPEPGVRRWQQRLNPAWKKIAGGCNMHRNIPELLRQAGWQLDELEQGYIKGPKVLCYNYWGTASKAV